MIDYEYLCQAIGDWRAGRRPSGPPPGAEVGIAEMDAELVEEAVEGLDRTDMQAYPEQATNPGAASEQPEEYDQTHAYGSHHAGHDPGAYAAEPTEVGEEGAPTEVVSGDTAPPGQPIATLDQAEELELDDDEVEVDEDDDEDWERDYDLEEQDDFASFDVQNDLTGYFTAHFLIEQGWENKARRHELFAKYGIRNEPHFYQVQASVDRYTSSPDAESRYGDMSAIMQLKMNATMDLQRAEMQQRAEGELAGELEPFEGVSLQVWAQCQAKVASGGDVDEIIAEVGIDRETWDRVSAEWNARMSRDTTVTIATEYGKAFSSAGQGGYADAAAAGAAALSPGGDVEGEPPIPLEKYIEVQVAQSKGVEQGKDAQEILASFGMTVMDYSNVSSWWSAYMSRHMMENDQALYHEINRLTEQFEAKYGAGDADDDIDY